MLPCTLFQVVHRLPQLKTPGLGQSVWSVCQSSLDTGLNLAERAPGWVWTGRQQLFSVARLLLGALEVKIIELKDPAGCISLVRW